MSSLVRARLRSLGTDQAGLSMIELGICLPFLCLMILGVVDLSMGVAGRVSLEQAAYRTLERATVGGVQSDYSNLQAEAATAANVPVGNVTVDNWLECNGTRQATIEAGCPQGQMASRYVQITIRSTYHPFFSLGPLGRAFYQSADGNVPIVAVAAVRVE
jgi:Flp pilus assembly protein TadG